jgi:hypothetical protein
MSIPLREPFFLRGRKSVVQRAAIMTVVLAALTAAAAWSAAIAVFAFGPFIGRISLENIFVCSAAAIFVHGPLHYWNARSWRWTLAVLPLGVGLLAVLDVWMLFAINHFGAEHRMPLAILNVLVVLAGSGLLQVRRSRPHLLAYGVSILAILLPATVLRILQNPSNIVIPGVHPELVFSVFLATVYGSCLGSLAIPWGIPFWWPPAEHAAGDEPS